MLIETIKNHPRRWSEETLKMASLPGHAKWICQEYVHRVQSVGWSTPDGFIAVILWSSVTFLSLLSIPTSPFPTICFYNPQSTSPCYEWTFEDRYLKLIDDKHNNMKEIQVIYNNVLNFSIAIYCKRISVRVTIMLYRNLLSNLACAIRWWHVCRKKLSKVILILNNVM